jgi:predicted nucleic acid-binding Zn ribbon protein
VAYDRLSVMIGYEYRCQKCAHEWTLFSKRLSLGHVQWGKRKYTCFNCQTFLSVVSTPDFDSWTKWRRKHEAEISSNNWLLELANSLQSQLSKRSPYTPVAVQFDCVMCPNCLDVMSEIQFGEQPMKCPQCGEFAGEDANPGIISIYGELTDDESTSD